MQKWEDKSKMALPPMLWAVRGITRKEYLKTYTHAYTHLMALFRTTQASQYQKGKQYGFY